MKRNHLQLFSLTASFALSLLSASAFFPTPVSVAGLDANEKATIAPINSQFQVGVPEGFSPPLGLLIEALPANQQAAAIDQLSPEKFGVFTSSQAFNNASFEVMAMDAYLASLRQPSSGSYLANTGGLDVSGLTVNDPDVDPALSMVHSRMLAWNPAPHANGLLSDIAQDELGGTDMSDSKDMKSASSTSSYVNPWHFFVRGNVVLAQGFSNQDVPHFDYNTSSVVLGTDYRVTPNILVGLTASYAHTDVTLDTFGSSATVDSYSPGLYASYADHGFYANVVGDYLHNAYTQQRVIGFLGQTATSAPQGNEGIADLDGGYDFHKGAFTFGPLGGVEYTHLSVDGYQEGGSLADLNVDDEESDSLRGRVGGHVAYNFSAHGMVIKPHLEAAYQHDFLDQGRGITSAFATGGGDFSVRTPDPSRDSAIADAGVDADVNRTLSFFAEYLVQAGQDNYFGQSVQAGIKVGF